MCQPTLPSWHGLCEPLLPQLASLEVMVILNRAPSGPHAWSVRHESSMWGRPDAVCTHRLHPMNACKLGCASILTGDDMEQLYITEIEKGREI